MAVYVWRDGKVVDKSTVPPLTSNRSEHVACPTVMNDIAAFRSPIDGAEISSRSALKEHERKHNVYQVGNDLKGHRPGKRPDGEGTSRGGWEDYKG